MSEADVNKLVGKVTRKILLVLLPSLLIPFGGFMVKDHFELKNKADQHEVWRTQGDLMLLIEQKTRAIESLVLSNTSDIKHIEDEVVELKEIQKEIDKYLRDAFRVRGYNSPLTEY